MKHFRILKKTRLEELKADLVEGVHIATDARFMHIANDDPENLFCLSFKTIPDKSDGVAHILEHTVLCGSEKFPVKDPFFAMTRRSLHTFMNALTGPDFTCYPASTLLEKDFYNLLEVYLDAVFHPKLNHLSFLQEGVRLEFKKPNDPSSGLQYKGIVFNEMKGELSAVSSRLMERMNHELYPDSTYGINSGGDPKIIPTLTYETLKAFHEKFYHPSQCLFFFYGNLPVENHLDFIHDKLLKNVTARPHIPEITPLKRRTSPVRTEGFYPLSPSESTDLKTLISFGWLTTSILDTLDTLAFTTLVYYLMDNDSSVLKRAILNAKLCKEVTTNYDNEITDIPFIINLKGCKEGTADEIEKVIFDALNKIVKEGVPLARIESVLHQKELARSEIAGNRFPFGLSLFMRSALLEQHGVAPEEGLLVHAVFGELRKKMEENPNYLTSIIQKHLIDNPHWVRLIMTPSHTLEQEEHDEEEARLAEIEKELTTEEKNLILKQTAELNDFQASQEDQDIDVLPKVTLDDVPEVLADYPLSEKIVDNLKVYYHPCFTNQIIYVDVAFDLPVLEESEQPYFRLLAHLLPQLGSGDLTYLEALEAEQDHTGGIWAAISINQKINEKDKFYPSLIIKGKALYRKKEEFFKLIRDKAQKIDFDDHERIKEVLKKHYSTLAGSLQRNALSYALSLSASTLSPVSKVNENWFGLTYYDFLKENYQDVDNVIVKLKELYEKIFNYSAPSLVISADQTFIDEGFKTGFWGLSDLAKDKKLIEPEDLTPWSAVPNDLIAEGRVMVSQVAFNAHAFSTISYNHPEAPAVSIAAHLFDNLVLHAKVREQGGAYGVGASFYGHSSYFSFFSSRDPHLASTFNAFEQAIEMVSSGNFEEEDLIEAKLEIIQSLDAPVAPGSRAELGYGWMRDGESKESREEYRQRVLTATKEEVIQATKKHIEDNYHFGTPVVFAGKELLEKEGKLLSKPLSLKLI